MSFAGLLDAAIAGAHRVDPPAVFEGLSDEPPERRLLQGASFEGLRRLAGRRLDRADAARVAACPPEVLPEAPAAASGRLVEILSHRRDLLAEWLTLAETGGYRVPHWLLVDLLEVGRSQAELAELIQPVGGERGAWLASQNEAWAFAARVDPEEAFSTGGRAERRRALEMLRHSYPSRGRELLSGGWDNESAEMRAELLGALAEGLTAEDEPLLQRAVGDTRKEVRQAALDLIRRIPNSEFGQRWVARSRQHVVVKRGLLGTGLEIHEPAAFDANWARDGVEPRPPKGYGSAGWWLKQMMALVPPLTWTLDSLKAFRSSDWSSVLVPGLAEAAIAYQHSDWCEELLMAWAKAGSSRNQLGLDPMKMIASLPPDRTEAVLRKIADADITLMATLVEGTQRTWSRQFSQFFIEHTPALVKLAPYAATSVLGIASLRLDPSVMPHAAELVLRIRDQAAVEQQALLEKGQAKQPIHAYATISANAMERLVATLEFRRDLRREFLK
jgi:Family of unknown function (DUF5691)